MKKNILAILTLLIPLLVLARPSSKEIEIKSGAAFFKATKTNSKLMIASHLGSRNLDVQDCNQKAVDQYWSQLAKDSKASSSPKRIQALFSESKRLCKNKSLSKKFLGTIGPS